MKVILINPPRENLVKLSLTDFIDLGNISSFPPIGLMYLAGALKKNIPDVKVTIIDCVAENLNYYKVANKVYDEKPHIIGITSTTYTFYDTWQTANAIKKRSPEIPIVIGGSHMYIFSKETMTHACFDYGVIGDGENVFGELCLSISKGTPFKKMKGLLWRKNGNVYGSGVAHLKNLNKCDIPSIELIDPYKYYSTIGKGKAVGTICTSRGCPFQCTFCQVPRTVYRMRSIENIIKEIKSYLNYGITDFFFFDDLFNITKKRVIDFCEAVLDNRLEISWMFRGRVDQIDGKGMKIAHKAGCSTISVGIEDYNDEGLRLIKKNITIDQAYRAVRAMKQNGIKSSTNWIIGLPNHKSKLDIHNLINTAIKIKSDYAQFSILQCLPGSDLFNQASKYKSFDSSAWTDYVLEPSSDFSPPIWEHHLKKEDLFALYSIAYRRYYLRPNVFFRELLAIRSVEEIKHKSSAFNKIFLKRKHKNNSD